MAENSITVENLTYRYGTLLAVDHISFEVGAGEILGFLGPNGAGKTTTVKMLTGQLQPQEGHAILLGRDIVKETQAVREQIGVCFEQTNLYEQMSALDNLLLFAELFGVKGFDGYALLKRVGLAGREKDKVSGYSKGMKQRLMVARSLVNKPQIIFMDEPTAMVVILGLGAILAAEIGLVAGAFIKDINTLFAFWKFGGLLFFGPAVVFMFPQIPSWVGYIFPTFYVIKPVTDLSVMGLGFGSVALYVGILIAIVAIMGLAVMNIVKRLSTQALRLN